MKIKDFTDKLELNKKVLKKDSSNIKAKKTIEELTKYLKALGAKIKVSTEAPKASKVKESFDFNSPEDEGDMYGDDMKGYMDKDTDF